MRQKTRVARTPSRSHQLECRRSRQPRFRRSRADRSRGFGRIGKRELPHGGSNAIASYQDIASLVPAIPEASRDGRRIGSIDFGEGPAELHLNTGGACCIRQHAMQIAAADHVQPRAEPRLIVPSIDGADGLAASVLKREPAARNADCLDRPVHVELGQHIHAVRRHPQEQPFVHGLARPTLADDHLDADPSRKMPSAGPAIPHPTITTRLTLRSVMNLHTLTSRAA